MTDDQNIAVKIAIASCAFTAVVSFICAFIARSTPQATNGRPKEAHFLQVFLVMAFSTLGLIAFATWFYGRFTFNADLVQLGWDSALAVGTVAGFVWMFAQGIEKK